MLLFTAEKNLSETFPMRVVVFGVSVDRGSILYIRIERGNLDQSVSTMMP